VLAAFCVKLRSQACLQDMLCLFCQVVIASLPAGHARRLLRQKEIGSRDARSHEGGVFVMHVQSCDCIPQSACLIRNPSLNPQSQTPDPAILSDQSPQIAGGWFGQSTTAGCS
jgi:hypothetical protein